MKILPFLTPLLFALSLSGTAHADVAVAQQAPIAPATIEAGNCPPHAGTECLISGDSVARADGNVDLEAMRTANPQQPAFDEAALPVPEPATSVMMALGLALLGFTARRRPATVTFDK